MKAMIFAAGLGTRLRPLTYTGPKALIEIDGTPLLELVIRRLQQYGVRQILVNVHHFADRIAEFLLQRENFGLEIAISDERAQLLDTGGGLHHAAWFFDQSAPFLLHNVDILSRLDLRALYEFHCCHPDALATLAVSRRPSTRCLLFNRKHELCGWKNRHTGETKLPRVENGSLEEMAFSGIHVVSPSIFSLMPANQDVFSIIEVYLRAAKAEAILAFEHDSEGWLDVGTPENLAKAGKYV